MQTTTETQSINIPTADALKLSQEQYEKLIQKLPKWIDQRLEIMSRDDPREGLIRFDDSAHDRLSLETMHLIRNLSLQKFDQQSETATEPITPPQSTFIIDRTKLDALNKETIETCARIFVDDDIAEMETKLRQVFNETDLRLMNERISKNRRKRKINWREFAFLACILRWSIMTNNHAIENGQHCGDCPTNRAECLLKAVHYFTDIGTITHQHASEVYQCIEAAGIVAKISDANYDEHRAARYSAKPSEMWGFPPI